MGRYNKETGDELVSTEEAAKHIGVSYITLRRWLASGDFPNWLATEKKPPLKSVELANGKHVWQFNNRNRADLREYRDLPERRQRVTTGRPEARLEKNVHKNSKGTYRLKVSPEVRIEDLESLEELLFRFRSVCLEEVGNTDPADRKRIAAATKALKALRELVRSLSAISR